MTSSTDQQQQPSSELAIRPEQTGWNAVQKQALAQLGMTNTNPADLAVFFHQCVRTGLDPFLRQIYLITRMTYNPDTRQKEPRATIQTGIDGYRLVASRAAAVRRDRIKYHKPLWLAADGQWQDYWIAEEPPLACQQTVECGDAEATSTLRFWDYAATKDEYEPDREENGRKIKGRKTGRKVLTGNWATMPSHMIAKCTQADALRQLFPQDLGGLYIEEEMERVIPNGKEIIDVEPSAPKERTGRDWLAEIQDAVSGEVLNDLYFQLQDAGEFTAEIRAALAERGRQFREAANQPTGDGELGEVVDPTDQDL